MSGLVQFIEGAKIPYGYEVWRNGVFTVQPLNESAPPEPLTADPAVHLPLGMRGRRTQITQSPVWISGLGRSADSGELLVCVHGTSPQRTPFNVWVTREQVADKRGLIQLAGQGVPVNAENGADVVRYLAACEAKNYGVLSPSVVGARAGYYNADGMEGWLIGDRWIGTGSLAADPREQGPFAVGFTRHGTPREWLDMYERVRGFGAVARMTVAASLAAPLIRHLGLRTFWWYLFGKSRYGKTAIEKFAMSAWGDPKHLKLTFNTTQIGPVETFRHITDLPVLVDERQAAQADMDLSQIIYAICGEEGRIRGKRSGGLRSDVPKWKTLVLASGEQGLIPSNDLGGQRTRVLEVYVGNMGPLPMPPRELHVFTEERAWGYAGPAFLERLLVTVTTPALKEKLRERYEDTRNRLAAAHPGREEQAGLVACVTMADALAGWWLLGMDPQAARDEALEAGLEVLAMLADEYEIDIAEKGLRVLRDHRLSNPGFYIDLRRATVNDEAKRRERNLAGIDIAEGIALIPSVADATLKKAGLPPDRVWREFATRGWLQTSGGSLVVPRSFAESGTHRVYFIHRAFWQGLSLIRGGLDEDAGCDVANDDGRDEALGE